MHDGQLLADCAEDGGVVSRADSLLPEEIVLRYYDHASRVSRRHYGHH